MAEGFLGRWSQRKQAVQQGKPLEEPPAPVPAPEPEPVVTAASQPAVAPPPVQAEAPPPPPTLQDVQGLTPKSDFQRYMAADVDPAVKNAAMKKLFADPHFNVMDGLDIYIDDYSKPDPLPLSMLRKMASAQFLGLVEEEPPPAAAPTATAENVAPPAAPPAPAAQPMTPPASAAPAANEQTETDHHADPDLRLQQDHAAGPQGSGGGA
jgi:hypothetical protein